MNSSASRIVITGIGLITSLGTSPREILQRIRQGEIAGHSPKQFDVDMFQCPSIADIPDFNPSTYDLDVKTLRIMSRDAVFAASAARVAVRDAQLVVGREYHPQDVALFGSTGLSGIAFEEVSQLIKHSARPDGSFDPRLFGEVALKRILPTLSFKILTNMPICFISIFENIQGMNAVYNPWEGQGARAIAAGIEAIKNGDAKCALVGGCEVKTNLLGLIGLHQQKVFETYAASGKPLLPAEGAAFLVLEREDLAMARKARIYASIGAYLVGTGGPCVQAAEVFASSLHKIGSEVSRETCQTLLASGLPETT